MTGGPNLNWVGYGSCEISAGNHGLATCVDIPPRNISTVSFGDFPPTDISNLTQLGQHGQRADNIFNKLGGGNGPFSTKAQSNFVGLDGAQLLGQISPTKLEIHHAREGRNGRRSRRRHRNQSTAVELATENTDGPTTRLDWDRQRRPRTGRDDQGQAPAPIEAELSDGPIGGFVWARQRQFKPSVGGPSISSFEVSEAPEAGGDFTTLVIPISSELDLGTVGSDLTSDAGLVVGECPSLTPTNIPTEVSVSSTGTTVGEISLPSSCLAGEDRGLGSSRTQRVHSSTFFGSPSQYFW